ncbi:MAG: 3-deoxy-D-manno-octulosonic acid transferase [Armatimonadota bacterium]
MLLAYNLLLLILSPLLALYLAHRLLIKGKSRQGLAQRLGLSPRLPAPPPAGRVWLHAVSAGEMVAAAAIARRLAELSPGTELVVSTTTPAGFQQAERLLPEAAARFYFPFDFLPCAALALLRVRPTAVAAVETEIWPNWLALARLFGAEAALVNGQFADKGFRGARRARPLYRWALGQMDSLYMQTRQAAERAIYLGARPERVQVVGNVKFEQKPSALKPEAETAIRSALRLDGRPLFLAGSTHPGEEEQVLEAFRAARERLPNLALLLAPRHVERAPAVCRLLEEQGFRYARRSELGTAGAECDVLVLDTMGELAGAYALAGVGFVGGSLVPVGGHDILQPLFHGKPTFFGPHMHNQHDLAALALETGSAVQVRNAAELAEGIVSCCTSVEERDRLRSSAEELLRNNTGAAYRCAELLARLAVGREQGGGALEVPRGASA